MTPFYNGVIKKKVLPLNYELKVFFFTNNVDEMFREGRISLYCIRKIVYTNFNQNVASDLSNTLSNTF